VITKTIAIVPTPAARESAAAAWQRSFALPPETADPAAGARVVILDHDQARAEALAGMLHPVAQDVRIVAVDVEHEAMATPFAAVQERARATPSWSPPVSRTQDGEPVPHEDNGRERERGSVRSYRARIPDGVPPHDEEAELAVLGSMALDPEVVPSVLDIVGAPDFYRTAHKIVFETMDRIHSDGQPLDLVVIKAALEHAGQLEEVGGAYYLAHVLTSVPSAANAVHYARIVRDRARERTLITQAHGLIRDVHRGQLAPGDLATHYAEALGQVAAGADAGMALGPSLDVEEIEGQEETVEWICEGLIGKDTVSLFSGHFKAGKTTFLLSMLAAIERGTPFLDRETRPTRALVLSEQGGVTLAPMLRKAGLEHARLYTRAHLHRGPWAQVVEAASREAETFDCRIVVVDTFASWAQLAEGQEQDAGATGEALGHVLRAAEARGQTWILLHHLRKAGGEHGLGARGSGNIGAQVDTLLELNRVQGQETARKLSALGRLEGLIDTLVIDLTEDGYQVVGSTQDLAQHVSQERFEALAREVLEYVDEYPGRTRREIEEAIPGRRQALRTTLAHLVRHGRIEVRPGAGNSQRREYHRPPPVGPDDEGCPGVPQGVPGCVGVPGVPGGARGVPGAPVEGGAPVPTPGREARGTPDQSTAETAKNEEGCPVCSDCGRELEEDSRRTRCVSCASKAKEEST